MNHALNILRARSRLLELGVLPSVIFAFSHIFHKRTKRSFGEGDNELDIFKIKKNNGNTISPVVWILRPRLHSTG